MALVEISINSGSKFLTVIYSRSFQVTFTTILACNKLRVSLQW